MATYSSNLILAGGGQATPSILVGTAKPIYGSVTVPSGVVLTLNDTLPLFNLGAGSAAHIMAYTLDAGNMDAGSTLTMSLLDSNASPTTLINASALFRTAAFFTQTSASAIHGTYGSAISYTTPSLIYLRVTASGTGNLASPQTIYFMFEVARD